LGYYTDHPILLLYQLVPPPSHLTHHKSRIAHVTSQSGSKTKNNKKNIDLAQQGVYAPSATAGSYIEDAFSAYESVKSPHSLKYNYIF
jgi:hypothetical protein